MKCIYNESQGYSRVTDEIAEKKTKTGVFRYAPKSAWKESLKQSEPEIHGVVIDKNKVETKKKQKLSNHLKLKEKQR